MKKILQSALAAALLLGAGAAQAQLSAGHILLTGSAGYSSEKDGVGDNSRIYSTGEVSPQAGYFIVDNLAIGVRLSYGGSSFERKMKSQDTTWSEKNTTTAIDFGPFVRYYKPVGEHAAFFGQLAAGFGSSTEKREYSGPNFPGQPTFKDKKYSMLAAGLSPGFTFFPTDHFGLEVSMGGLMYSKSKLKDKPDNSTDTWEDDSTATSLEARFGLQDLRIGATWYLGGK